MSKEYVTALLAADLSDEQIGDLFIWLRRQFGDGLSGPPRMAVEFSSQGQLLGALQQRRLASSVSVLDRIEIEFPNDYYVRKAVLDAKRLLVEDDWKPLDPATVKRIIEDKRQLLLRDEDELMEAVCCALDDYQESIRSEGSGVMRLWNERPYKPKMEKSLSREIGEELQRILATRGVKATLETKIREGQFVDIYVTSITKDAKQLSLIIEVKGCWHGELTTALQSQLADRYLEGNKSNLGIYLAVWFLCDKWDDNDSRKKNTPKKTLAEIKLLLESNRLDAVRSAKSNIRVYVLDATI